MSRLVETEALVTVVQEGSFAAARERLKISSSYVSKLARPPKSALSGLAPAPHLQNLAP